MSTFFAIEEENVLTFGRSSNSRVNPLAVYDEEAPLKNGDLAGNGGSMKGVTGSAVAMYEVLLKVSV